MKTWVTVIATLGVWSGWMATPSQAQIFTEVGSSLGMSGSGPGAAWGDYDNDGDLDLYVASLGDFNVLYQNNGDGTFVNVTAVAGVSDSGQGVAVSWGDYDNDGDLDLYLVNRGQVDDRGSGINRLYRNNGDGTFTEVGGSAGVSTPRDGQPAVWGDYDNDGDLDLYADNSTAVDPNRLYRNNGDGTFTEVGGSAGVDNPGRGAAWGDYDNDGDLDLYVTSIFGENRLYRNEGNGVFAAVEESAGVDDSDASAFGPAWGDYDSDGYLDLYVANQGTPNRLYRNNGDGTFAEVGDNAGVDNLDGGGHGVAWGDYDNDGDLDLHVVAHEGKNRLYRNNGDGTFTDVAVSLGMDFGSSLGSADTWGDYDNDGDLDLYVANINPELSLFYRNEGTPNHWLQVKLQGTTSNRSAIGARVVAITGEKRQRWDVDGGSGFCSQPSLPVEFGFGQTTTVDSLCIFWPSGMMQVFTQVTTDQRLEITEGEMGITAVEEEETATLPSTFSLSQNYPNPFNSDTVIRFALSTASEVELGVYDLAGQRVALLVRGAREAGSYAVSWDGRDERGEELASGTYLYRLRAGTQMEERKLLLLR